MNISYSHCLPVIAGMLSLCLPAAAQQPSPPALPPPPLHGNWKVSYKKNESTRKPSKNDQEKELLQNVLAEVKSRDYTVNGELGKSVTHYSDGKSVTMYAIGNLAVGENPQDTKDIMVAEFSGPWLAQEEFRKHYPEMAWVVPSLYKGRVEINNATYHYFAEEGAASAAVDPGKSTLETPVDPQARYWPARQAWFGMDGRPVFFKNRRYTATFTFKSMEARPPIEIPERFRAVVQRYLDSLAPKTPKQQKGSTEQT